VRIMSRVIMSRHTLRACAPTLTEGDGRARVHYIASQRPAARRSCGHRGPWAPGPSLDIQVRACVRACVRRASERATGPRERGSRWRDSWRGQEHVEEHGGRHRQGVVNLAPPPSLE
jgi:hypothetical protein